jgi:hypothetical protein
LNCFIAHLLRCVLVVFEGKCVIDGLQIFPQFFVQDLLYWNFHFFYLVHIFELIFRHVDAEKWNLLFHPVYFLLEEVLLEKKFNNAVLLTSIDHFFQFCFEFLHLKTNIVFLTKHHFPGVVQYLVIMLEKWLNFMLMAD